MVLLLQDRNDCGVVLCHVTKKSLVLKKKSKAVVTGAEMFRKQLDRRYVGDNVGVLLRGIQRDEIERGQALAAPGSINPHN